MAIVETGNAYPFPPNTVRWATGDTAEMTDPGTTKTEDGYDIGDAPASSHMNYIMHAAFGWSEFLQSVFPAEIAWGNVVYETGHTGGTNPFGDASDHFSVMYSAEAARWYVLRRDTGTSSLDLHESPSGDAGTWTTQSILFSSATTVNPRFFSLPVIGGGILAIADKNKMLYSTDTSAANIVFPHTLPFSETDTCRGMAYNPVSKKWVIVGNSTGDGRIEYADHPAGPWTVAESLASYGYSDVACSPNGWMLAVSDNLAVNKISSDGVTWNTGPTISSYPCEYVMWAPPLNRFIMCRGTADDMVLCAENSTTEIYPGYDLGSLAMTDEFVLSTDAGTEETTAFYSFHDRIETVQLGPLHISPAHSWPTDGSVCIGGQGKLIWPWDPSEQRAIAYYGAVEENK